MFTSLYSQNRLKNVFDLFIKSYSVLIEAKGKNEFSKNTLLSEKADLTQPESKPR